MKSRRAHTHCRPQTARPQLQMKYHPELPRPHIAVYGTGRKATSIDQRKLTAVVATNLLAHTRSFCQTLSPIRTALSTIVQPGDPQCPVYMIRNLVIGCCFRRATRNTAHFASACRGSGSKLLRKAPSKPEKKHCRFVKRGEV